jgi:thiamine pyrophosphokinase
LKRNVEIKKMNDQNSTDFEKCLQYCVQRKLNNILVFCGIGLRPDHTLNNYSILKRYAKKLDIKFVTDEFEIFFIDKKTSFKYKPNETVSFLALPRAIKIKTSGLEFPLFDESLEFGVREGTLNKSVSDKVSISFSRGSILMFKKHFI